MGGWAEARDIVIFLFCVVTSLVVIAAMVLLARVARLVLSTGQDTRGILHSLHATTATVDVTTSFLTSLLITPVARLGGLVLGVRSAVRSLLKRRQGTA